MNREQRLQQSLGALQPLVIEITNESHMHSGNRQESHYKVLVVSTVFEGKSRIDRQRMLNDLVRAEFDSGLHALTQRTLTPKEWEAQKDSLGFVSPNCGGKK